MIFHEGGINNLAKKNQENLINHSKVLETYVNKILDIFNDGIYISDSEGKTIRVNKAYEQLTGLKQEELLGKCVKNLMKEGIFDSILNPDIVKSGKPKSIVQVTKVGKQVVLNGYPVFGPNGKVALVVTFVRDVTLLSQLKEQIASQQEFISNFHMEFQYLCNKNVPNSSIIVKSQVIKNLLALLHKVAQTDATVLLLGETGVGKDIFAKKIHTKSIRSNKPFFKVDCTSIPENLIESELFGYEAGAFSGANAKGKPGFFEMADGGTLFLDEIGELPLPMQSKLLRVLQDQEIMRIGSTKVKKVDVRFIAATNKNLEDDVKKGTFRSDLYYRLKVAVLNIPPLRERKDDIIPLAKYFFERFNYKYKKNITFSKEVEGIFLSYKWPGNVREMENFIQSLIVTREKNIVDLSDLPSNMLSEENNNIVFLPTAFSIENRPLDEIMDNIEREILKKAMDTHGNISEIANNFRVNRSTIFRKLKKYSLIE